MTATEDQTATVPPLAAFLRPQLPPAALYGLPGEVATTLAESSGADPAAVLVTFLALLGNAAGPQPHARFGGAEHPARLFAVLVGDAATGRKGTALAAVENLFAEADPDWATDRVLYGLQSAATTDLEVINSYLSGGAPILGVVELGGRVIPATQGYRARGARVAAILLIDEALTEPHHLLRELAEAYRVPALIPISADPEDYREVAGMPTVGAEAEAFLRARAIEGDAA